MSAISWNCRRLGNPLTVNALQKVVLEKDPKLVFLMETKFVVSEMDGIKRNLERQQGLVVPSIKRAGGLALLWRNTLQVDIQTYSPRHINAIVSEEQGTKKWCFTGFYGHSETGQREESWKLLENLSHRSDLPWICMGDYNEIMHAKEKEGGGVRPEGQMRKFREVVNRCQLKDLGYMGLDFTWSRRLGSRGGCVKGWKELWYQQIGPQHSQEQGFFTWPPRFQTIAYLYSRKHAPQEIKGNAPRCGGLNPCGLRTRGATVWFRMLGKEGDARSHSGFWKIALRSAMPP